MNLAGMHVLNGLIAFVARMVSPISALKSLRLDDRSDAVFIGSGNTLKQLGELFARMKTVRETMIFLHGIRYMVMRFLPL